MLIICESNWVFTTSSDFLIPISWQPNVVDLKCFKLWILISLSYPCTSFKAKSWDFIPTAWVLRHIAWMPYLTFTRLNLYLDLPPVIGFRLLTTLWKANNKRKPIAQLLRRNFENIFAYLNLPRQWLFKI